MLETTDLGSTLIHNPIFDDVEDENPCEDQIRADLDKVLDDDIDDADDWEDDENEPPNASNHGNEVADTIYKNTSGNVKQNTTSRGNTSKDIYSHTANNPQNGLRHAYQHNGGQWPPLQPLQPPHPYLKSYPIPGMYQPPFYPFPPAGNFEQGYESRDTFDSSEINNTDQVSQLSRDDFYPVGADKTEWDSQSGSPGGGSNHMSSDVFVDTGDVEHQPEQLNALYRANQRKLDQITAQLQETQETYTKQIHQLQHEVGLLKSEKSILETQASQSTVRTKQLINELEVEKREKEDSRKRVEQLNEQIISLELDLQEKNSDINRLNYQLKDSVPKKQSDLCEGMLDKATKAHEQQVTEFKKKLDTAKREIVEKDLLIEKLKVELQNSVKDKITTLEADLQEKEAGVKNALEELLITLPKINMIDINMPLVTEVQNCGVTELTAHLNMITARLCDSESDVTTPRTLVSLIEDLRSECDVLRHTAAQLQSRVAQSEQAVEEANSRVEAKARAISYMEGEVDRLTVELKEARDSVKRCEQRESDAVARERDAMEKVAAAEKRCEQTLIEQTNTLKRMRSSEETSRLEKHSLENKVEEFRLQVSALQEEIDKNKDLYVNLSQDKDQLRKEYEKRLENFQQKASDEMLTQLREVRLRCEEETEELLVRKEEEMLSSFEEEKEKLTIDLTSTLTQAFEKRLESEIESSQKQWSGSTDISTLAMLEMSHRGVQTDKVLDSLNEAHYAKIWQAERTSELSLARETAVALARANWEKEKEKTIRNRVDIIVRSKKEEWLKEAYRANEKEVDDLKTQLKQAVNKTEDMRHEVEVAYKESLSRSNEEYKSQMSKLLRDERERNTASEKRLIELRKELNEMREEVTRVRNENSMYMQGEVKYKMEVDKLQAMFEQLKCTEQSLLHRTETHSREMESLNTKLEEAMQKEVSVRGQCESVICQMKEELVKYAESANSQAMAYVERAVAQCKEHTASKYKKYYQRLLYCLVEKHPNVKETVKHLQQSLPKQVSRIPLHSASPRTKPIDVDLLTQRSTDSGFPSTQRSNDSGLPSSETSATSTGPGKHPTRRLNQVTHSPSRLDTPSPAKLYFSP